MKIIIDTNIILSARIKDSLVRKIIIDSDWGSITPKILFTSSINTEIS